MNWYYVDAAGQQAGPVDDAALDALAASGGISAETLVWREGMPNWVPLRTVKGGGGASAGSAGTGVEEAVCAECGGIFPVNDTIRVGNARVCANCKPVFVQKMREGVNIEQPGTLHYAGFWTRFGAYFLDVIILWIVNIGIGIAFGLVFGAISTSPGNVFTPLFFGLLFVQLLMVLSYETFMIGKYGATVGKMACKIKVVAPDGSKISYARAAGRYFSKIVSGLACSIGFIMAGFDDEKRALHDRMCDTRVVFK